MLCKHYKDSLSDAAGRGAVPPGELRAHLAECASCRAVLAEEQSLFDAIDSGLHAAANSEVPTSLLPRVRTGLDKAAAPRFRWTRPLVLASAGVALAFGVFLLARPHQATLEEVAKRAVRVVPRATVSATKSNPEKISPEGGQIAAVHVNYSQTSRNSTNRHSAASSNPEVLVPADEREWLARFAADLRQGRVLPADAKSQSKDLTIAPSEIAPIEVKGLESAQPELR